MRRCVAVADFRTPPKAPVKTERFNIAHIVPATSTFSMVHGLYGYREVIETLHWGLTDLGYDVTISENQIDGARVNIVLGAQMLADTELRRLPDATIVYNFEQIGGASPADLRPEIRTVVERFRIWEYSQGNMATWEKLGSARGIVHVPVGWAPVLKRIRKPPRQDIDALIYGTPGRLRLEVFHNLCHYGMKCLFVCGMYGEARDELIARSKLVLNLNVNDRSRIFEIVRVSYLLSNSKAVVADLRVGTFVEPDIEAAVAFCEPGQIRATCMALLESDDARLDLENRGREIMQRRHISPILSTALEQSEPG
jgi:hypothetical protein